MDTIDVTNLNRQFLFQRRHVGMAKSEVAKESAVRFNPKANITAIRDSIMSSEYGVSYFQKFDMVLNALDNRAARSHVNRMCLAADIPLVESGTAGYLGQVTVIRKGKTECYDCTPKPHQKSFPGCTIRKPHIGRPCLRCTLALLPIGHAGNRGGAAVLRNVDGVTLRAGCSVSKEYMALPTW